MNCILMATTSWQSWTFISIDNYQALGLKISTSDATSHELTHRRADLEYQLSHISCFWDPLDFALASDFA